MPHVPLPSPPFLFFPVSYSPSGGGGTGGERERGFMGRFSGFFAFGCVSDSRPEVTVQTRVFPFRSLFPFSFRLLYGFCGVLVGGGCLLPLVFGIALRYLGFRGSFGCASSMDSLSLGWLCSVP